MGVVNVGLGGERHPGGSVFVGPYRLVGTLGEGGMGVVHLALDPAGRAVAVKVLKPHVAADAVARRRLGREVSSLRRVRHPNVAEVLDADLDAPSPYVVTAFIPARTLDHQVHEHGSLPVPYVAHLGRVMAGALRAIHRAGVVHRDVKPANVLLLDDAPILIDFGIAHVVDEARITSTGLVMGTPGYLPPELVEGRQITPATDWWGWGATLAYAATGRAPFGSGPPSVVLDRVRRGHVDLAGVDPRLGRVLAAALTVDPALRATGDMLLTGLTEIEAWRPGDHLFAPALRPDQVRTVPVTAPPPGSRSVPRHTLAQSGRPTPSALSAPTAPVSPPTPPTPPAPSAAAHAARATSQPPAARDLISTARVQTPRTATKRIPAPPVSDADPSPPRAPGGLAVPSRAPVSPPSPPPGSPSGSHPGSPSGSQPPGGPSGSHPDANAGRFELGEHAVPATLAAALAALAATATVAPGLVVVLSVGWLVIARVADRTMTATARRRYEFGPRAGDVGVAVAALPWRVLASLPGALFSLVFPVLLAGSAAFLVAAVVDPATPDPATGVPLAAACVCGWLAAWWGPGGGVLRRGTRGLARVLVRRRSGWRAALVLLGFVLIAALLVARGGAAPDWEPLGALGRGVPRPCVGGLIEWLTGLVFGGFSLP